jgi:hypothetical protein
MNATLQPEIRLHIDTARELIGETRLRELCRAGSAAVVYVRGERRLAGPEVVCVEAAPESEAPTPKKRGPTQTSKPCDNCGATIERRPGSRGRLPAMCARCK